MASETVAYVFPSRDMTNFFRVPCNVVNSLVSSLRSPYILEQILLQLPDALVEAHVLWQLSSWLMMFLRGTGKGCDRSKTGSRRGCFLCAALWLKYLSSFLFRRYTIGRLPAHANNSDSLSRYTRTAASPDRWTAGWVRLCQRCMGFLNW